MFIYEVETDTLQEADEFKLFPEGWHKAKIVDTTTRNSQVGFNPYVQVIFEVELGLLKRRIYHCLMLSNFRLPLQAFCRALGLERVEIADLCQSPGIPAIHGMELDIKIKHSTHESYGEKEDIVKIRSLK